MGLEIVLPCRKPSCACTPGNPNQRKEPPNKILLLLPSSEEKFKPQAPPRNAGSTDALVGLEAGRAGWTHIILKEIPTGFKEKQNCYLLPKLSARGWR